MHAGASKRRAVFEILFRRFHKIPDIFAPRPTVRRLLIVSAMNPKTKELQERTHRFFVRVSALCDSLPHTVAARKIGEQLVDSAGSTDSNYRAACRGRTKKEFIAKLGVATEEADESIGWLRSLVARQIGDVNEAKSLLVEADELVAIFVKSQITAKQTTNRKRRPRRPPR